MTDIRQLIGAPKPAFVAEGVSRRDGPGSDRSFNAVFDGQGGWVIQRPDLLEFTSAGRTILVRASGVEVIEMPTAVNNDVKSQLDAGRIAHLAQSTFEEIGSTVVADRACRHVRARGLNQDDDAVFQFHVDDETGVILRSSREPDAHSAFFEVTSFRVGTVISPQDPGSS